jgi:predicted MPP superfamily phosphohydrolase
MSLFFFAIFAIYGGMHAYAFSRARAALGFSAGVGVALALFMLAMTFAPFLVRLLERHDYPLVARIFSYFAYFWMALLFLFFCGSIVLDIVNSLARIATLIHIADFAKFIIPIKWSFAISLILSLCICLYGYFDAQNILTERLRIETGKLPAGINKLTIVQISDVHLGLIVRSERLKKIVDIVRNEKPDIFVSTGDLVDAQLNNMEGMADLLQGVHATYGAYAITGNHEYYAGIQQALAFTKACGFTMLRGEAAMAGPINIAGVDDPAGVQLKIDKPESDALLLSSVPKDRFTILLKHRPVVDQDALKAFDLQLSGHTHKGQIYPFTYVSEIAYPLNAGRFDLRGGAILRVSRGTGTWGPPIRFLSPPEVTVIELVRRGDE